ncbi:ATP-binding cassette domain-containing protein [Paenibacillus radicis (ex Gao et al. 2016)]|uniref:ABC transporter ATP-binding protein n=1 Tax=Paenibacillus radicis (ex Gao et al. 2016) TaxID=1737354 RepID=A0A917GRS4_9BACL|nr:ABC transporter ATP-binding protein [Paenibacillus radicis (ex Gao et al. 2016)]GGG54908.1 ABC transporter ATP-binding protein [Paenibacillus radicis (ex Gao et al. 2016)]
MLELQYVESKFAVNETPVLYVDNLTIKSGEIVGLLGANGSGKTTLLKAIMGLGDIRHGEIKLNGRPVSEQFESIAFITEEGSFPPRMTPERYARFLAEFYPSFSYERYVRMLQWYDLELDKPIKSMSKGQKSKLEICAGFAKGAKTLLMDEPFQGKDLFARQDFLKLMVSSLTGEETLIITTHLIDEIENVIDRAIILKQGRVAADRYIDDIRQEGKSLSDLMAEAAGYKEKRSHSLFD